MQCDSEKLHQEHLKGTSHSWGTTGAVRAQKALQLTERLISFHVFSLLAKVFWSVIQDFTMKSSLTEAVSIKCSIFTFKIPSVWTITVSSEPGSLLDSVDGFWREVERDSPRKGRAQPRASGAAHSGPQLSGHRGTEEKLWPADGFVRREDFEMSWSSGPPVRSKIKLSGGGWGVPACASLNPATRSHSGSLHTHQFFQIMNTVRSTTEVLCSPFLPWDWFRKTGNVSVKLQSNKRMILAPWNSCKIAHFWCMCTCMWLWCNAHECAGTYTRAPIRGHRRVWVPCSHFLPYSLKNVPHNLGAKLAEGSPSNSPASSLHNTGVVRPSDHAWHL